jgi:hypothetical protein
MVSLGRKCAKLRIKVNSIHCFIEKTIGQNNGMNGIKEMGEKMG